MKTIFEASVSWGNEHGTSIDGMGFASIWSSGMNETGYFESKEDAEQFIAERKDDTGYSRITETILWEPGEYTFEKSEAIRIERNKISDDLLLKYFEKNKPC